MRKNNQAWLPSYCQPSSFLPKVPETRALFSRRAYVFQDFLARAMSFLASDQARKMGFDYQPASALPCKWKCSDESVFGVDLHLYAFTGQYPFDKGLIGGHFNESSLGAAVHHGRINLDFGGSHVGYLPGQGGGLFGQIWRPLDQAASSGCGYLVSLLAPFKKVYDDACENILIFCPSGEKPLVSVPNEFLQPNWSSGNIKLLVDLDALTEGEVAYLQNKPHTHTMIGRSLFYLHREFLQEAGLDQAKALCSSQPTPIGRNLGHRYFNIFDAQTALDEAGLPQQKLLLYMKFILAAQNSHESLKAAIVNTILEHNRLTDAVRAANFKPYDFVSFTGLFIDMYDEELGSYVNLFQPLGLNIKPKDKTREVELTPEEIHHVLDRLTPAQPKLQVPALLEPRQMDRLRERFTYQPGIFAR